MALPNRNPSDLPRVSVESPALAYSTKANIALPIEAQRQSVAALAKAREEDSGPQQSGSATKVTGRTHVAPPNE